MLNKCLQVNSFAVITVKITEAKMPYIQLLQDIVYDLDSATQLC